MEMNHIELQAVEQKTTEIATVSIEQLDDLQLVLVGGGTVIVNFEG